MALCIPGLTAAHSLPQLQRSPSSMMPTLGIVGLEVYMFIRNSQNDNLLYACQGVPNARNS